MNVRRHPCGNRGCATGRHWTRAAAESCYRSFLASQRPSGPSSLPRPLVDVGADLGRRTVELRERRRLEQLAQRLADYTPRPAPDEATRRANLAGERQLLALRDHLHAVDALMATSCWKMNTQLRDGVSQEVDDWLTCVVGYDSYDRMIADVARAFAALGSGVELDHPARAFRGASTATHDLLHLNPGDTFTDHGYLFATTTLDAATYYADRHTTLGPPSADPIVLTLHLHAALYVPAPDQRTMAIVELASPHTLLDDAAAQYVVPVGSTWRVDDLSPATSTEPARAPSHNSRSNAGTTEPDRAVGTRCCRRRC